MRVRILGAGTAIPVRDRSPAGVYVRIADEHVLLDAGAGTTQRLSAIGVSLFEVDRVFLTHYHIDHCLDLASILFALRLPQSVRKKPLTVYGPAGLQQLYRRLNAAFSGWLTPRTYRLILKELTPPSLIRLAGYRVTARRMRHAGEAVGYRLETRATRAGHRRQTIAYSGDTDVCPEVIELAREADVLILECAMTDERKVAGHLTPTECGRVAAAARCRHLALTHLYPVFQGYDIRRRIRQSFAGRLTIAEDLTLVVS